MKLGRNASDEEVASYLNITVDELKKKLDDSHTYNIVSLEEQVFENLNKRNTESVNKTPEDIIEAKELKKDLIDCIDKLSNRENLLYHYIMLMN